ncbi:MAG: hypothetical protein ABIG66_05610 [Candidatus Kerfeldbacteria bacterium]
MPGEGTQRRGEPRMVGSDHPNKKIQEMQAMVEAVQVDDVKAYRAADAELWYIIGNTRSAFERIARNESDSERDIQLAEEHLEAKLQSAVLLAKLYDGTAERLSEYPEELIVPEDRRSWVDSPEEIQSIRPGLTAEHKPYMRMDVKGRTYVNHLADTGAVEVYENGKYKGGNHDLALYEIGAHLHNGDWFGVNA